MIRQCSILHLCHIQSRHHHPPPRKLQTQISGPPASVFVLLRLIIHGEAGETFIQYKQLCATYIMYFSCFSKYTLVKK